MFLSKIHDQTILEISQGDSIGATVDSFLMDRQTRELSIKALKFYKQVYRFFVTWSLSENETEQDLCTSHVNKSEPILRVFTAIRGDTPSFG